MIKLYMISSVAYTSLFGFPLILYGGIVTLICLLITASIGFTTIKGIKWITFKYHRPMAAITITLAIIHGILGLSIYFNF
jgi:hypothetical protein